MAESSTQEKMQAAQNELLQNQERQKALLQQRQAEVSAMANMNQTLQQAAEVAVETAGGNQAQAQQFAQSTGAILGKYGMPIVQRSSSSTPQGGNVVINNTNNITVPPMQHQPIVVRNNEESSGGLQKFKAWLTGVFAKQSEEVSRRDREFSRQEGYLSRTSSKIMKRLEEFGSTVAETMNPKRIAAQMGSQLKTMLFLFGTYFLMANWGKILHGITEITKKLQGALDYFGITGDLAKQGKGFIADIKNLLGGKPGDSLKTIFSDIFRENVDIVTSFFKKEWEIRAMAAKQIKFPMDSLKGGMFNFIQNVGVYLGDLLSVLLTGPKGLSGSIGHSISNWGRQNSLGEGQAWANKDINHLTHFSRNTSLGDASIVSGGNTTISQDFSGDRLSNGTTASIRQGQAISAMIKDNSGKVNTSGVMSGLKRLKEAAGSKGVLVDPSFLESFVELGIPAEKLYAIASKGTPEYYKFVREEKGEADLADEGASFNRAFLERSIKNKAEDALGLGYIESVAAEAATNSFGSGHTGLNTYTAKSPLISGATAWINKQFIDQNTLRMVPESDPREGVTINGRNKWEFLRLTSDQLNELKALLVGASGNAKFSFSTSDERSMESLDKMLRYAISRRTGKNVSMMAADYDSNIWENVREVERFKEEKDKEFDEKLKSTRTYQAADKMWTGTKEFISSGTRKLAPYWDSIMSGGKALVGSNKILQKSSPEVKRRVAFCMKKLIDAGLSPGAAAGIVGNLLGEGLTTKRFDHEYPDGSGPSAGIAGFHSYYNGKKGELDNLKAYARSRNRYWGDLDVQVDYLIASGSYPSKVVNKIRVKTNGLDEKLAAEEAAYLWGHDYERFKGYNLGKDSKEYRKRIANALSVLENYSGIPIDFDATKEGIYEAELGGGGQVTKDESGNYVYTSSSSYSSSTTSTGSTTTGDTTGGSTTTTSGETSGKENKGLSINFDQSKTVSSGGLNYRGWGGFIETSTPDGQYSAPRLLTKSEFEEAQARIGAKDAGGTPFSLAFQGITKTLNDIKALNYDSYTQMIAEMHGLRKTAEEGNNIAKETGKKLTKKEKDELLELVSSPDTSKVADTSEGEKRTLHERNRNMTGNKWVGESDEWFRKRRFLGELGMSYEKFSSWTEKRKEAIKETALKLLEGGGLKEEEVGRIKKLLSSKELTEDDYNNLEKTIGEFGGKEANIALANLYSSGLSDVGLSYNQNYGFTMLPETNRAAIVGGKQWWENGIGSNSAGNTNEKNWRYLTTGDATSKREEQSEEGQTKAKLKKLTEFFEKIKKDLGYIRSYTWGNVDGQLDYSKTTKLSTNTKTALDFWPVETGKNSVTVSLLGEDLSNYFSVEAGKEINKKNSGVTMRTSSFGTSTTFYEKETNAETINRMYSNYNQYLLREKQLAGEKRKFYSDKQLVADRLFNSSYKSYTGYQITSYQDRKNLKVRGSGMLDDRSASLDKFTKSLSESFKNDTNSDFSKSISELSSWDWGRSILSGANVSETIASINRSFNRLKFFQVASSNPKYRKEWDALLKLSLILVKMNRSLTENVFGSNNPEDIINYFTKKDEKGNSYLDVEGLKDLFGSTNTGLIDDFSKFYELGSKGLLTLDESKAYEKLKNTLGQSISESKINENTDIKNLWDNTDSNGLSGEEALAFNKNFEKNIVKTGGSNYYRVINNKTGRYTYINENEAKKYGKDLKTTGVFLVDETEGFKNIKNTNSRVLMNLREQTENSKPYKDPKTGKLIRKVYTYKVVGEERKPASIVEIPEEDWQNFVNSGKDIAMDYKTASSIRVSKLGRWRQGEKYYINGKEISKDEELKSYLKDSGGYLALGGKGNKTSTFGYVDLEGPNNTFNADTGLWTVVGPGGQEFELTEYDHRRLVEEGGLMQQADIAMWDKNVSLYKQHGYDKKGAGSGRERFTSQKREGETVDWGEAFNNQTDSIDLGNKLAANTNSWLENNNKNAYTTAYNTAQMLKVFERIGNILGDEELIKIATQGKEADSGTLGIPTTVDTHQTEEETDKPWWKI